ncbi:helix-turn-helix transcriptional regulator, partial [Streptomyces sp. 13-12-16]|uniref:helix-turn-helix domain-containing protein n=1 Tax=Streptomyces sp. 13-12-16 TaxID=1570823 RepID=UPI002119CDAE
MSENTAAAEFAAQLRALKERSGLSYGVLAKRLHMSTSTLHRYCNGDAVPTEYAPVERLARLCKARPEELVELHRKWVLADVTRGRKGAPSQGAASAGGAASVDAPAPAAEPAEDATVRDREADGGPAAGQPAGGQPMAGQSEAGTPGAGTPDVGAQKVEIPGAGTPDVGTQKTGTPGAGIPGAGTPGAGAPEAEIPAVTGPGEVRPRPRRRTRTAVLAGIAVAAVLGGGTFALGGLPDGGDGGGDR